MTTCGSCASATSRLSPFRPCGSSAFHTVTLDAIVGAQQFRAVNLSPPTSCTVPRSRTKEQVTGAFAKAGSQRGSVPSRESSWKRFIPLDTTIYGIDFPGRKPNICDLLRDLEAIGFYSIRLLYLYPSEISDELIDLIASSKVIAHYFDVPVQTASDHLLKAMRRHAGAKETIDLFARIKEKCPDAILRTTLIAGFPGETEEDQKEALDLLKTVEFDHMGCFVYSREEGTASYDYPDQVKEEVAKKRRDALMKAQAKISYRKAKSQVGKVFEGLVTGFDKEKGKYMLRCVWNAPDGIDGNVYFSSPRCLKEGEIVSVRIVDALVYDLLGELVID